jgi:CRP-like cAMP-binding protein
MVRDRGPLPGAYQAIGLQGNGMLSSISFFSDLSAEDRDTLRQCCTSRKARKGEDIVHQGSHDREMYIVVSGKLKISAVSEDGKEVGFGVLSAEDTFGEMAMLDGEVRSATVTAIEKCELLVLGHEQFVELVPEHPHVAINLLIILTQRLRHTSKMYQDSIFMDVPARLAQFLLQFSKPPKEEDAIPVMTVSLSQYELGTLINASRESVNKQLREWEIMGVIEKDKGEIRLLDPDELRAQAYHAY